jgi:hypothetical protein
MRWIPERAEALLHLRCIELNGEWDQFYEWQYNRLRNKLQKNQKVIVRSNQSISLDVNSNSYLLHEESLAA